MHRNEEMDMNVNTLTPINWSEFLTIAMLVLVRVSGLMVFAPIFSSIAIPMRIKAGLVLAITLLLAPVVSALPATVHVASGVQLDGASLLGELAVGMMFGFSLNLLNEALLFAGFLLGMEFSFSLVNLLDPNTRVDTPILGQLLGWLGVLVLIGAGLDRTLLAALMRSFATAPVGQELLSMQSSAALASMAGGIFLAGLQLAAPVLAATMAVEVTVSLIGRLSPQLPVMFVSIPAKTLVAYVVLIGSLAIWPSYIERYFVSLLNAATRLVG
ncbi:MAG: flagellar biosynthetic protein FliR [Acidobacteriaceae bacterium]